MTTMTTDACRDTQAENLELREESTRLSAENAALRVDLNHLRTENARLREQNRELRIALDNHIARMSSAALYGPLELTAGTSVGPRRRRA